MSRRHDQRHDHIVIRSERDFDPAFEHHTPEGFGIVRNKAEGRDVIKKLNDRDGRRRVFDPDGGMPSVEWEREQLERKHARIREGREALRRRQEELRNRTGR